MVPRCCGIYSRELAHGWRVCNYRCFTPRSSSSSGLCAWEAGQRTGAIKFDFFVRVGRSSGRIAVVKALKFFWSFIRSFVILF